MGAYWNRLIKTIPMITHLIGSGVNKEEKIIFQTLHLSIPMHISLIQDTDTFIYDLIEN